MTPRTLIRIFGLLLLTVSCVQQTPWPSSLYQVSVQAVYPEGYENYAREGVKVRFSSVLSDQNYTVSTDKAGSVRLKLPSGLYRISLTDRTDGYIFNGSESRYLVTGDSHCDLPLVVSEGSPLLIRELYVGGCSKAPKEGVYQSDQYVLLHNNSDEPIYLDSLCFGTLSPYNSTAVNRWLGPDGSFPSFAPVVTVVWGFPGDGTTYPLAPGEDALIALRGAIDHTLEYPLSVNLNRPDCFVCYNPTYFPNPLYHPAPGDRIRQDHILDVVIKTGQSNANVVSMSSPTFLIFKAKGTTMEEYVRRQDVIAVTPGNSADVVVKVPWDWVIDAVEVFNGSSTGNNKRLPPQQDAGFVAQMDIYKGYALTRHIDEEASRNAGYTILQDSNNSSNDFYQTETPLLRR